MKQGEIAVDSRTRDDLNRFAGMVWGKPQALSKHHCGGFEFIDLGDFLKGLRALLGGALRDTIFVRDEYRIAVQELQTDRYIQGAYVTGQPGIGKSLFLVYLLITLLGQQCKVAMHDTNQDFYVVFTNTVAFYPLTNRTPLSTEGPMFALSDSNKKEAPPSCFYDYPDDIRLIQATSPKKQRWHEWSKQVGAECYVMDIWTGEEIANLAKLRKYDVQQMLTLGEKWGGVPRTLAKYLGKSDEQIEGSYRNSAKAAIQKCENIVQAIVDNQVPEDWDVLSRFYFYRPAGYASPNVDRSQTCATIPTHTICYILGEALEGISNTLRLHFFNALRQSSETQQAAGFIYQSWFDSFFSTANKFIYCHSLTKVGQVTELCAAPMLASAGGKDIRARMELPYYWAVGSNYPGIDSALIRRDAIYVFQIALSSKHSSPQMGVQKLWQMLPADLKDLPWHVVFVGNVESLVRAAASEWVGKVFLTEASQTPLSVAWSAMDPVAENVTYKMIRDVEVNEMSMDE